MIKKVKGIKTNKILIDNRKLITFNIPEYKTMLDEMLYNIKSKSQIYPEYKKYLKN